MYMNVHCFSVCEKQLYKKKFHNVKLLEVKQSVTIFFSKNEALALKFTTEKNIDLHPQERSVLFFAPIIILFYMLKYREKLSL